MWGKIQKSEENVLYSTAQESSKFVVKKVFLIVFKESGQITNCDKLILNGKSVLICSELVN